MLKTKRFISAFLVIAILFTPLPKNAEATVLFSRIPSTETAVSEIPEATIFSENIEKREKNIKHFFKEDMSFTTAVYLISVHFKENGNWKEIDNSLAEGVDEEAVPVLENKKYASKVRIAKNSNARSLVNIKKGIHEIGWNLAGGDNTKAVVELHNLHSTVRYNGILPGIDLEYQVLVEEVKETIIIREKMEVPVIYIRLYLKNVVPKLSEGNRIVFHDAASGGGHGDASTFHDGQYRGSEL